MSSKNAKALLIGHVIKQDLKIKIFFKDFIIILKYLDMPWNLMMNT